MILILVLALIGCFGPYVFLYVMMFFDVVTGGSIDQY